MVAPVSSYGRYLLKSLPVSLEEGTTSHQWHKVKDRNLLLEDTSTQGNARILTWKKCCAVQTFCHLAERSRRRKSWLLPASLGFVVTASNRALPFERNERTCVGCGRLCAGCYAKMQKQHLRGGFSGYSSWVLLIYVFISFSKSEQATLFGLLEEATQRRCFQ